MFDNVSTERPGTAIATKGARADPVKRGDLLVDHIKSSKVHAATPGNIRVSGHAAPMDCNEGPVPVAAKPVVITWDPVTRSHPEIGKSGTVKVTKYQMVIEREEPTSLVMSLDLPPAAKSFRVPAGLIAMDSGDGFKFEIVVRESSGNQTVFESCFKVQR